MTAAPIRPAGVGIAGAMDYHPPVAGAEPRCWVCGGSWKKGGASYAARAGAAFPGLAGVPVVEVCSAACAADPRFAPPGAA